ncbi:MAG: Cna B-type domain-containing protein [Oscillospiraceae bacterium]|nr:Cna B-type domain-containing protein [Oscillospiraceae bacterium]
MRRKMITLCVTALLILTCSLAVFAQDFDWEKTGVVSVTLTEQYKKEPIVGAELSVYYVATVAMDADGNLIYDYTEDFKQLDTAINDTTLATKLDAFVSQHSVPSVKITTNAQGTALCDGLSLGLYFVKQTGNVEGFAPCTPFLVTVPNEKDGEYVYEVNASPKTEVARLTSITIKKVWNTDASTEATESVTVQLLQNGNVVKAATLNAQNNWQVTYTDMPESDAYSIQEIDVPKGFTATYSKTGYVFTVTNTSTLAQTGQRIWPIPVLSISGMLLIAVGITLLQKKRNTNA